jgi:hypothetical protein
MVVCNSEHLMYVWDTVSPAPHPAAATRMPPVPPSLLLSAQNFVRIRAAMDTHTHTHTHTHTPCTLDSHHEVVSAKAQSFSQPAHRRASVA